MEARVTALDVGFLEMRGNLHRLELSFARIEAVLSNVATKSDIAGNTGAIDALAEKVAAQGDRLIRIETTLSNVATKADVAALSEKASAQGDRLTKVETAIEDTIKTALSKTIGPWQVPGILAVCVALIGVLLAVLNWAGHQPWFPH
jgi:hypothetical protein